MTTVNQGDYLRVIYNIYEEKNDISFNPVDVAKELKFSKAAVSKMMKRMDEEGFVKIKPYSSFCLTSKGLKEATKLTRKHRIIEVFLLDALKVDKKNVHKEAHRLEHALSDDVVEKLNTFLEKPRFSPFGREIPKV